MNKIEFGDCRETMRRWKDQGIKAQTCVTSPPYFGLRDYGHEGQIGLEETPDEYIKAMVEVFRCVWDVLEDDGTLWLNIGDSYNNVRSQMGPGQAVHGREKLNGKPAEKSKKRGWPGLKEKDLIGIPWMLAFALRADGWYLRQDIIWHKPNPMPESVQDRCTKAHEYIFLMSKSQKYYYDADAIKDDSINTAEEQEAKRNKIDHKGQRDNGDMRHTTSGFTKTGIYEKRNKRSVWTVTTKPYAGAHFAVFPSDLIEPCILAGAPVGGIVLDPFMGSGTTAQVAQNLGRQYIGCELNPAYVELQNIRTAQQSLILE
jgi:DNA modification methylase